MSDGMGEIASRGTVDGHAAQARVERALLDIAAGRPVVVVDDADRENEGDLIFAAQFATPELVGFMVRHTSGFICAPLPGAECDRLGLPPMREVNEDARGTAYTVTVDARHGITTGISAADRCRTLRVLADPATGPEELTRPGHVVPLRGREGGVLTRPGHTEATLDLCRLAGVRSAGVLCELVHDDGSMMRAPALEAFARRHDLAFLAVADLVSYREAHDRGLSVVASAGAPLARPVASARLPTRHGTFRAVGYRAADGGEHLALVLGEPAGQDDVLVRVHSECLTGDALGSLRCDCGPQLDAALAAVAARGCGVVVYLRGHEGRGIGLLAKLRAYALQEDGADTVEANLRLGLPADARDYGVAAAILTDLGVRSLHLLSNNPAKQAGLQAHGVTVRGRVPLVVPATAENIHYLRTKRDRMGHDLGGIGGGLADPALPGDGRPAAHPLETLGVAGAANER